MKLFGSFSSKNNQASITMEFLFYCLKVSAGLLLLFSIYWFFLRQHTYFSANRFYLLAALLLSLAAPLVEITTAAPENVATATIELGEITATAVEQPEQTDYSSLLLWVYALGAAFMCVRLAKRLRALWLLIVRNKRQTASNHVLVSVADSNISSFSFLNYLVMSQQDEANHRNVILRHEAVHIRQRHSLDLLLVEVLHVFLWFNPVLILYKRALQEIHEFIADELATAGNRLEYARELVGYSFGVPPQALVNPFFNSSQLKNRIVMLNKNRSSRWVLSRYLLALPILVALVLLVAARKVEMPNDSTEKITVKGYVYDKATKQPMPGVSVDVIGGNSGTNTDVNGTFLMQVKSNSMGLAVSFVGFRTEMIDPKKLKGGGLIEVALEEQTRELPPLTVNAGETPVPTTINLPNEPVITTNDDEVFVVVEQNPEFPGGSGALLQFLGRNVRYPAAARRANVQGKVFVQFVVNKEGDIQDIRILKGIGFGCDEEAVRAVSIMPKWKPAQQRNARVAVQYNLPIEFVLDPKATDTPPNPPPPPTGQNDEVLNVVEQQPEFVGGITALTKFIGENIQYPAAARRANVQGKVFLSFVVAKDGQVQDVTVLKGLGFGCDDEALRVVRSMPKWNPGKNKGKVVAVRYSMPIQFLLEGQNKKSSAVGNPRPSNIRITTNGTIGQEPLWILDGVELSKKEDRDALKPDDIESMDVLKGEKAKIYGEKGKNGVILITTKKK